MRVSTIPALLIASTTAALSPRNSPDWPPHPSNGSSWDLKNFTSLVVFGDSYSDDSRLAYFIAHNGSAPPVAWVDPVNYRAADGGRIWGEYVKQYAGLRHFYNYAVAGAVCSNDITPRWLADINAPFPAVAQYEVPAYLADSAYTYPTNGSKFLVAPPDETVYVVWIGTNDYGYYALVQDEQVQGTNLTSVLDCVFEQVKRIYDSGNGARYFVLINSPPVYLAPEYALPPYGVGPNQYWPTKPKNHTLYHGRMLEEVVSANMIYEYRTPVEVELQRQYPGASFALYDVNGLMTDIYNNPSEYLNGSAPLDVTGYVNHCSINGTGCVANPNPDSFMWFDELHPTEQVERIFASEFVKVVRGTSKWASYYSG